MTKPKCNFSQKTKAKPKTAVKINTSCEEKTNIPRIVSRVENECQKSESCRLARTCL